MRLREFDDKMGPIVAMMCRCSVWPIALMASMSRCGECNEYPKRLPEFDRIDRNGEPVYL